MTPKCKLEWISCSSSKSMQSACQFSGFKGEVKDQVFLPLNEAIFTVYTYSKYEIKKSKFYFSHRASPGPVGRQGKFTATLGKVPRMWAWSQQPAGSQGMSVPSHGQTGGSRFTDRFSLTCIQWVRNSERTNWRRFLSTPRYLEPHLGVNQQLRSWIIWSYHLQASLLMLVVSQDPQLGCGPEYLHMFFPCHLSVWATLGFLTAWCLVSKWASWSSSVEMYWIFKI